MGFDWATLNRVQFYFTYTRRLLFRAGFFGHPTSQGSRHAAQVISLDCLARDRKDSHHKQPPAFGRSIIRKGQGSRSRDGSSGQKIKRIKWSEDLHSDKAISREIRAAHIECPSSNLRSCEEFPRDRPIPNPTKTDIDSSPCYPPNRRVHKVRKEILHTESEYSLRQSVVWAPVVSW